MRDDPKTVHFLMVKKRTAFFKLQDVYPECFLYREKESQIEPLVCLLSDSCFVGKNCMKALTGRLHQLFDEVLPEVELIVLYYRKRNLPGIGAGIFWSDFREPRLITVNQTAWETLKRRGEVYRFTPEPGFWLKSSGPRSSQENRQLSL